MDTELLVVPGPGVFVSPDHTDEVNALASKHPLVLLLQFGDQRYNISGPLPHNVKLIKYDYDTVEESVDEIRNYLSGFGVSVVSRHKRDVDPLPFVLTGSILTVPADVSVTFLKKNELTPVQKIVVITSDDWDLL